MMLIVTRAVITFLCSPHEPLTRSLRGGRGHPGGERGGGEEEEEEEEEGRESEESSPRVKEERPFERFFFLSAGLPSSSVHPGGTSESGSVHGPLDVIDHQLNQPFTHARS